MTLTDAAELEPFTADQKRALRECRFVTTNRDRSHVVALTADKAVADAVGISCRGYQPDRSQHPERWDYELTTAHLEAVAVAVEIMGRQAAARAHVPQTAPLGASA